MERNSAVELPYDGKPAGRSPGDGRRFVPIQAASLWKRSVALLLDGFLLAAINAIFVEIGGFADAPFWDLWWAMLAAVVPVFYFIWPFSTGGQTLGKLATNVRIVSVDGRPLTWRHGVLRYAGYTISSLPFGLVYLWAGWDRYGQAWHDKIAGTVVVEGNVTEIEPIREPEEIQRRQLHWLLGIFLLIILFLVLVAALGASGLLAGEAQQLTSWPSTGAQPAAIVPRDLSRLGPEGPDIVDARSADSFWSEERYESGVPAEYVADGEPALWMAALRYDNEARAGEAFTQMVAWAQENCCRCQACDHLTFTSGTPFASSLPSVVNVRW